MAFFHCPAVHFARNVTRGGVDLHASSFTICRRETGSEEEFETFQLSMDDEKRFCLGLDAEDSLAVEGEGRTWPHWGRESALNGNSSWFCDQVRTCVGRLVVVNARRFGLFRKSVNKTDRNDARALAYVLSKDMLPETRLRAPAETELGSLVQTRDVLVKQSHHRNRAKVPFDYLWHAREWLDPRRLREVQNQRKSMS